jgi:hypothetical protein
MVHVAMGDDIVHIRGDRQTGYPIGAAVRFDLNPRMVRFFDPQTERAIEPEAVRQAAVA